MQINSTDSHVEILTTSHPTHTVIWLHGLGADGHDFVPIVPELALPDGIGIKFIFPHAPVIPVTINNGYKMRAWFDIYDLSFNNLIDANGIQQSVHALEEQIQQEMAAGLPSENIILAGFSQGAVIALATGLTYHKRLGGLLILSGFLPLSQLILNKKSHENRTIPIFMAHGREDSVLPYHLGESTATELTNAGYRPEFHAYTMQHSVCAEEIRDMSVWLQGLVA